MKSSTAITALLIFVSVMSLACTFIGGSPSDTVLSYADAAKRKDVETVKSLLSKGSLEMFEAVAAVKGVTTDELLLNEAAAAPGAIEIGNEVITGETATVEIKNFLTGKFDIRIPLVKEDGQWKLARDVYTKQIIGK
jgi:hypothetical protein